MKKTGIFLVVSALLLMLFPSLPVSASGDAYQILNVKWHYGYVGSMGNALGNENKLGSVGNTTTSYRYTDVVEIEKAGTTVWFTEKGSGSSGFCARTGYAISSWKKVGDDYVLDTSRANYPGTDGETAGIATRSGDSITYIYTTSYDHELLRFCFCITNDYNATGQLVYPTIYYAYTQIPGSFADQCAADSAPVVFNSDGTVSGFSWFDGYVGSDRNDLFYVNEIRPYFKNYKYSGIITVPTAGTTISFTVNATSFADATVYTISSWKPLCDTWELDTSGSNFRGEDKSITTISAGTRTYSYTTTTDNENLRLCFKSDGASEQPVVLWQAPEAAETDDPALPEDIDGDDTGTPDNNDTNTGDSQIQPTDRPAEKSKTAQYTMLGITAVAYISGCTVTGFIGSPKKPGKKQDKSGK